jgi:hypothetical protein
LGGFFLLPQQDLAQLDVPMSMFYIESKSHDLQMRPQFNQPPKNLCFFNISNHDHDQGILTKNSNSLKRGTQIQQVVKQKLLLTLWPTSSTCLVVIIWLRCLFNFLGPSFSYLPFVGGFPTLLWTWILCDQHKEKQTHTKLKTQKNKI